MLAAAALMAACGKSDADLTKAVNDKLTADKVTGVTASVKDGVATLSGEVADVTVKTHAETSAKGVDGIKSVDSSKVTLKPLAAAPTPNGGDQMLKGTIEESIKKLNITGITVDVKEGDVTLTGDVSKDNLAKVMQAVSATNPKHITNNLKVK